MREGSRFGALAERPFRLLWLGQTTSGIGDALVPLALTFAVLEVGGATGLGLSLAALMGTRAVLVLAGGVWADRLPRRLVMLACDVVRAVVEVTTVVVIVSGLASTWYFVCTSAVFGAASAFFSPASTGLIPQIVSAERLQQANALVGLSRSSIGVFGPLVSGIVVAAAGPEWVFGINAASFVISALFLARLPVPARARGARQKFLHDLAEGWREVRARSWVAAGLVSFAFGNVGIAGYFVLGPLVVEDELGGARDWGVMLTGGSIGGILGGMLALRFKPKHPLRWSFLVILSSSIQICGLIPPLPVYALAALATLAVTSIVFGNTLWVTTLQERIPEHVLSRVTAYDWMVSLVFMPLGYVVAAPLADGIGLDATLVIFAGLGAAANLAIMLVPSVRNMRRLADGTQEAEAVPAPATV